MGSVKWVKGRHIADRPFRISFVALQNISVFLRTVCATRRGAAH